MTADDVCLVIYSSGTTGRPKGVMLTQRGLVAHTRNVAPVFSFTEGDANLVAMPLFHVGGSSYALFGIFAGVRTIMTRTPIRRRCSLRWSGVSPTPSWSPQ